MAENAEMVCANQDGLPVDLPAPVKDGSPLEVLAAADTSLQAQDQFVFLDFEETAGTVFGQLDMVDHILAGKVNGKFAESLPESATITEIPDTREVQDISQRLTHKDDTNRRKVSSDKCKGENGRDKGKEEPEHILKALNSLHTTEEKLAALCKKYADLMEEHRTLQTSFKHSERKNFQMQKEKEQLQTEHSKAILTRSRLESLCRELQRQNRTVKDESLMRVREEEEKRKEVSAKFQTTFNEITNMMQDNNQKSSKLREENVELATKLKSLIEQYEAREQQVDKLVKHKDLEVQLADAKLAKAAMEFTEEREKFLKEKHQCLQSLAEYQKKCQELTQNEIRLRTQLNLYTDKYEEFQQTLSKSNEVFTHFKDEMDKMSKKIKKLEKETGSWRSRWESSNKALLEMATEKQRRDTEYLAAQKKILQLEKLCRALQTERQCLIGQIKGESNSSPALVQSASEVPDVVTNVDTQTQDETKDSSEVEQVALRTSSENVCPSLTPDPVIIANTLDSTVCDIDGPLLPSVEGEVQTNDPPKEEDTLTNITSTLQNVAEETPVPRVQSKAKERGKKRNKGKHASKLDL